MSIFASFFSIEDERQWMAELEASGIKAGVIRDGEPAPEDLDAPIIYKGSHVLPADTDPRGGAVHLALIPSHITRDGRDDKPEDESPWPYLRLDVYSVADGVSGDSVILTLGQVKRLRAALGEWVDDVEPVS